MRTATNSSQCRPQAALVMTWRRDWGDSPTLSHVELYQGFLTLQFPQTRVNNQNALLARPASPPKTAETQQPLIQVDKLMYKKGMIANSQGLVPLPVTHSHSFKQIIRSSPQSIIFIFQSTSPNNTYHLMFVPLPLPVHAHKVAETFHH